MQATRFRCLFVAAFLSVQPALPNRLLDAAKQRLVAADKISILKSLIRQFPTDPASAQARGELASILANANRYDEALQVYQASHPADGITIDFTLIDYLLKTGRYADVLQATSLPSGPIHDFVRDHKVLEARVQALLAGGRYQMARESVDGWLAAYGRDGIEGGRFEGDVRAVQFLRQHLVTLERDDGPRAKPIFTAAAPGALNHWSRRQDVPIYFFKVMSAHPGGQLHEPLLPGRYADDNFFSDQVDAMNRGFRYISQGQFSLELKTVGALYLKEGDLDPSANGGSALTSRVYAQTIPELYQLAGDAFIVLVDYREQAADEAAYLGDGFIHVSARKLQTFILMHEVLHGLGATHNDWTALQNQGFQFDPQDRGLMTFDHGELRDLGLEEKNRALLGWPAVSVVHFNNDTALVPQPPAADIAANEASPLSESL